IMRLPLMRLPWSPQSRSRSAPAPPQRRMRAPGTTPQRRPGMFRTTAVAARSPTTRPCPRPAKTPRRSRPQRALTGTTPPPRSSQTVAHHQILARETSPVWTPRDPVLRPPADNLLHTPAQPDDGADPAHPYVDENQSASADDSNAHPGKVPHDPPAPTARSSDLSGDDSAQPFKTNLDHHAVDDPETNSPSNSNNHPLRQPADNSLHTPAQQDHNGSPAVTDGAHLGSGQVDGIKSASPKLADDRSTHPGKLDHHASADPDINDQHPADNSLHTLAQHDHNGSPAVTD